MRPILTIEINVRISDRVIPLRCALNVRAEKITEALQPIHTNDTTEMYLLEGVNPFDNNAIRRAREEIAEALAHDITNYLLNVEFAKNDTHNGYKKNER